MIYIDEVKDPKQRAWLLELKRIAKSIRESAERSLAEMETSEYKEKVLRAQEKERIRNKGFPPGESWRDIEIT